MIIINQLHLALDEPLDALRAQIADRLKLAEDAFSYKIVKESLDARRRENAAVYLSGGGGGAAGRKKRCARCTTKTSSGVRRSRRFPFRRGSVRLRGGRSLSALGRRGSSAPTRWQNTAIGRSSWSRQAVPERTAQVDRFWQDGTLDLSSNVQFGEGGAGTFSDGKLTSRQQKSAGA